MVMSGRCLCLMGLLPNIMMSRHPKPAGEYKHTSNQLRFLHVWMDGLTCITTTEMVSQTFISFAWRYDQPIYVAHADCFFSGPAAQMRGTIME